MREIKFRGYSNEQQKWVYGSFVDNIWFWSEHSKTPKKSVCEIITTENNYDDWTSMDDSGNIVTVEPESVGQFTGLKEKNKADVYEGDIVKIPVGVVPVTFDNGCFYTKFNTSNYRLGGWGNEIEVIGNVFENPELLTPTPLPTQD